jgi:hypothetical protein
MALGSILAEANLKKSVFFWPISKSDIALSELGSQMNNNVNASRVITFKM